MARRFRWSVEFVGKEIREWVAVEENKKRLYDKRVNRLNGFVNGAEENPGVVGLQFDWLGTWYMSNHLDKALFHNADYNNEFLSLASFCKYWRIKAAYLNHGLNQVHSKYNFNKAGLVLAQLIAIGAMEEAAVVADISLNNLKGNFFSHKTTTRLAPFVLALYCRWKNIDFSLTDYPGFLPIGDAYEAVLKNWNTNDSEKIRETLKDACDFHVSRCGWDTDSSEDYFEFSQDDYMIYPVEILMLTRIRETLSLETPEIDHELMSTPLAKLLPPMKLEPTPLLEKAIARLKEQYPELDNKTITPIHSRSPSSHETARVRWNPYLRSK